MDKVNKTHTLCIKFPYIINSTTKQWTWSCHL